MDANLAKMRKPLVRRSFAREIRRNWMLFLMILPACLLFLTFQYLPMTGVYFAFTKFNFADGLFGSPFVGLDNFRYLASSGTLGRLIRNTVLYNITFILLGNFFQIVCAVFLSEVPGRLFKRTSQSVMFLPYFISMVLVGAFAYNLLNYSTGVVNTFLVGWLGDDARTNIYNTPKYWPFIITFFNIWKGIGYGMVVYLAAITGIDQELYEAARIDGASVFQQVRHITLPLLTPTIVILLIFAIGGILKGQFDLFYQLVGNNGALHPITDVIDTFVYRSLMVNFDVGMGSAAGVFQSVFGFVLVMIVNFTVRKLYPDYALF
ncbi:MAG: ABC transporter permease subunit [Eubacteriales bacterium]|nr:ABC transporter permease subunit [Eubacteriales bacterium]